jgi:hypothetical protein
LDIDMSFDMESDINIRYYDKRNNTANVNISELDTAM